MEMVEIKRLELVLSKQEVELITRACLAFAASPQTNDEEMDILDRLNEDFEEIADGWDD